MTRLSEKSVPAGYQPSQPLPGNAGKAVAGKVAIWPLVFIAYSLLLPPEVRVDIGSVTLYATRIACFLMLPFLARDIRNSGFRPMLPDYFFGLGALWILIVMIYHEGSQGIESGGGTAFDMIVPYIFGRTYLRQLEDLRRFLVLILPGLLISGGFIALESISHRDIIRPMFAGVFGEAPNFYLEPETRIGLMRARGMFSHPILGGLFLGSFLPLYVMLGKRHPWARIIGCCAALLCIFTVSSAPLLAVVLVVGMLAFDFLQSKLTIITWRQLLWSGLAIAVLLELATSGFIRVLIRYFTFNPSTGYFRLMIWEYGWASVRSHPILGLGMAAYERPDYMYSGSVDNQWLIIPLRYGLPSAIPYYLAVGLITIALIRAVGRSADTAREMRIGLAFSLVAIIGVGFTVAFFGSFPLLFSILLGGALTLSQPIRPMVAAPAVTPSVRRFSRPIPRRI